MPRRISAEVDMQILADLGVGMLHRVIAEKYSVSPSYVSKLALGKKVPDIHVAMPRRMPSSEIETDENGIEQLLALTQDLNILASNEEIIKYLRRQVHLSAIRLKIYSELLNKYQGGN